MQRRLSAISWSEVADADEVGETLRGLSGSGLGGAWKKSRSRSMKSLPSRLGPDVLFRVRCPGLALLLILLLFMIF